jgi:hypothetical protein
MAISPKKIQEIRDQRAQIKASREKERLALKATDIEALNNAVTEDSKTSGTTKIRFFNP